MKKFVAIIPARGGSKRIPGKNIALLNGAPMISYPIFAAVSSGVFDSVIVSTDDTTISEIAFQYGAEVPFSRSSELSDDYTPTIPVIRDAIDKLKDSGNETIYCCIYPTSIFLTSELLRNAAKLAESLFEDQFLVSVTKFPYPIQRALIVNDSGNFEFMQPENALARSQDLVETYHDAAQFYWGHKKAWLEKDSVFTDARGVEIDNREVQDIDTPADLLRAELIMQLRSRDAN